MKLLVIARDYSHFVSHQFVYQLLLELAKQTELYTWHERGMDISSILECLNLEPDFVLILEYYETNATKISGLSELKVPYAIFMNDLHYDIDLRSELIAGENIKYIFAPYRDAFFQWYPEFKERLIWLPHHINTAIFRDYHLPASIDYLMMGALSEDVYPLRFKIYETMKEYDNFVYHPHPGYRNFSSDEEVLVRERYARELNRAKIFLTCDSLFHYPVTKYFEVPACNTLLMASTSSEIQDLGFIPGVNFVAINENDFEEKARYYLAHEQERLEIASKGYEMVRGRHSTADRTAELINRLEEIINQRGAG